MFSLTRDGHHYSIEEGGFVYRSPSGREIHFPFSGTMKLAHCSWTGRLALKGPEGKAPLSPLQEEEQKALLLDLFQRWRVRNLEAAKKAAFDYCDAQKGFVAVAFIVSLAFCLPLSVGLLSDSREQFTCTKLLQQGSVVGAMDVVKFKRKRKGHYILDLAFTAPNGTRIEGRDQLITQDEAQIPKTVPVVYSPERPSCWSLTPNLSGTEVNWAKRRYFGYFTGMFGAFFLATALYGTGWSLSRWLRPRPFRRELRDLFAL